MNRKGQVFLLAWMTAIVVLFLTLGYINPLKDNIMNARDDLQCSTNTSLSDGTKILCLGLDTTLWYFIGAIIVAGFGVLWSKKSSGG